MEKKIVKLIFKNKIYRKYLWTVPIVFQNDVWYTGQNLSYNKMTGTEPLTEEEKAKYPYVINPTLFYKVNNNRNFDLSDPSDFALYNLCLTSEKIAASKSLFVNGRHEGYFEDKEVESEIIVKTANKKFLAYQVVNDMAETDLESTVLLLNYTAKKEEFNINAKTATKNEKMGAIYNVLEKNPEVVLNCFEKYNPSVKDDIFIMKLLHHKLIIKSGMDFYEATNGVKGTYIGSTIERIKDFLLNKSQSHLRDKFAKLIEQIETGRVVTMPVDIANQQINEKQKVSMLILQTKADLMDGELDEAKKHLDTLLALVGGSNADYISLVTKYNKMFEKISTSKEEETQAKVVAQVTSDIELFKAEWEKMELPELVKLCNAPTNGFAPQQAKEYMDTKERLIEYMVAMRSKRLMNKYTEQFNK